CGFRAPAEPNRDRTLNRHGTDTRIVYHMLFTAIIDERLSPQLPQHGHLLFYPASAYVEVFDERFVIHMIPAETDDHTQTSAAHHINRRWLLRYECRLSVRQNEDACCQLDASGHCPEKTKQHYRLVKWMFVRVRTGELALAVGVRAEHVIVDEQ